MTAWCWIFFICSGLICNYVILSFLFSIIFLICVCVTFLVCQVKGLTLHLKLQIKYVAVISNISPDPSSNITCVTLMLICSLHVKSHSLAMSETRHGLDILTLNKLFAFGHKQELLVLDIEQIRQHVLFLTQLHYFFKRPV